MTAKAGTVFVREELLPPEADFLNAGIDAVLPRLEEKRAKVRRMGLLLLVVATFIYGVRALGDQACRAIEKGRIDDLGRA